MKHILKTISTALLVVFVITSCDVTNQTPQQSLPSETVLQSEQGANATLAGAYSAYQGVLEDDYVFTELAGDNATHSGSYPSWAAVDQHNMLFSNAEARDLWIEYYDLVNITNNLIANVPNIDEEGFSDDEKNQIVAESKVLRALAYHSLVRFFGDVPLVTTPTTSLGEESFVPRSPVADVYTQIISDLTDAESLLGANGSASSRNVTGWTAKALLARVYLAQGNYSQAEAYADEVITSGTFSLGAYDALYGDTPTSNETIFRLAYTNEDANSLSFFARPNGSGGRYEYAPSQDYLSAFESGDIRRDVNLMDVNADGSLELGKYFTLEGEDDVIVVRLGEMYLIRAEAGIYTGADESDILDDINTIRNRASLPDRNDPTPGVRDYSDEELLDFVLQERSIELAQEGHRWHDLNRLGLATSTFGIDANMTLWPIPQREMESNPELEQNAGY